VTAASDFAVFPVHVMIRKSFELMTRKLSVPWIEVGGEFFTDPGPEPVDKRARFDEFRHALLDGGDGDSTANFRPGRTNMRKSMV
jgi:hypothetical protein